jgi:arabinogalactan endo-1,4-beta-galactosidase
MKYLTFVLFCILSTFSTAQSFYLGADLSYVNEMEDCGVVYKDSAISKDPYQIFANHGCNLARFRLWHTPSFYDTLNQGKRYSDFADVKKSIFRAKTEGMEVLLDFHLSDFWADPQRQLVPVAWQSVVNNLPILKDSLYNHVYNTLIQLNQAGLMPEMVQIGNETNKGIMLAPAVDAAGWSLDWTRNSALFKRAIQAVRDAETATGKDIKVALHIAGPADAGWLMTGFWIHGVTDFDIIGLSYYWAWHKPTTIVQTGDIITQLKQNYPGKEVMIFETGYIWTLQNNDNAANIISETQAGYTPASPENQKKWLVDLTKKVIEKGGKGVIYWEPAWVSSTCFTPWGQGSHQDHATFFDFNTNVLPTGGMYWMSENYGLSSTLIPQKTTSQPRFWKDSLTNILFIQPNAPIFGSNEPFKISFYNTIGQKLCADKIITTELKVDTFIQMEIPFLVTDKIFVVTLEQGGKLLGTGKVF